MTLLVTLWALWGPVEPFIPTFDIQILGPSLTLVYPETLSAMTYLPTMIPQKGGLWAQSSQNTIVFWKSGFLLGVAGHYHSEVEKRVGTHNSVLRRSGIKNRQTQIILGFHGSYPFGLLIKWDFFGAQSELTRTWLNESRYGAGFTTDQATLAEIRLVYARHSSYWMLRVGGEKQTFQGRSVVQDHLTQQKSLSAIQNILVQGAIVTGFQFINPQNRWLFEISIGTYRKRQSLRNETYEFLGDSLIEMNIERQDSSTKFRPSGNIRIAWLHEENLRGLRGNLGVAITLNAWKQSVQGDRRLNFEATIKIPFFMNFTWHSVNIHVGTLLVGKVFWKAQGLNKYLYQSSLTVAPDYFLTVEKKIYEKLRVTLFFKLTHPHAASSVTFSL